MSTTTDTFSGPIIAPGIVEGLDHVTCTPAEASQFVSDAREVGIKLHLGLGQVPFIVMISRKEASELMRAAAKMSNVNAVQLLRDRHTDRLYILAT